MICIVTGQEYVGCSDDIKRRWEKEHWRRPFSKSEKKRNYIRLLYEDIRLHGLHNFKFEVIHRCTPEERTREALFELEKRYIRERSTYNPAGSNPNGGYNLTTGGAGAPGMKHTEEQLAKSSGENHWTAGMTHEDHPLTGRGGENHHLFGRTQPKEAVAKSAAKRRKCYRARRRGTDKWTHEAKGQKAMSELLNITKAQVNHIIRGNSPKSEWEIEKVPKIIV